MAGTYARYNGIGGGGSGGSGISSVGPVGSSPNADGASVAGSVLTLEPANGTYPGVLTASGQTIGGSKQFTGSIYGGSGGSLWEITNGGIAGFAGGGSNDYYSVYIIPQGQGPYTLTNSGGLSSDNGNFTTDGNGDVVFNGTASFVGGSFLINSDGSVQLNGAVSLNPLGDFSQLATLNSAFVGGQMTINGSFSSDNGAVATDGEGDLYVYTLTTSSAIMAGGFVQASSGFTDGEGFSTSEGQVTASSGFTDGDGFSTSNGAITCLSISPGLSFINSQAGIGINSPEYAVDIKDSESTGTDIGNSTTGLWHVTSLGVGHFASVAATGTVTGSNLSGTNTGNVTLGAANGLSLAGQALSLGTASSTTTGALTSTDWNTFNSKQGAFSGLNTDGVLYATSGTAVSSASVGSNGQVLMSGGAGVAPAMQTVPGNTTILKGASVHVFTSSGTYTPSSSPSPLFMIVEVVGAGGGGGGVTGTSGQPGSGGGGGGGEYIRKLYQASSLTSAQTITIGTGGSGGSAGSSGGAGGNTTFGSLITAHGGNGGTGGIAAASNRGGTGGTGGSGGSGDISIPGAAGGTGINFTSANNTCIAGYGGGSHYGPQTYGPNENNNGASGQGYGAGGSGGASNGSNQTGGNGSGGLVIVTEYFQ